MKVDRPLAILRGGGDLGTGAALRLHRAGWRVLITELAQPLVIRRTVAFASAIYDGSIEVEGAIAHQIDQLDQADQFWAIDHIPVIAAGPDRLITARSNPTAIVDAIISKTNTGTRITDAPIVVALGPGFTAGIDCHAVVETNRGHNLGRVYYQGSAEADTGTPGKIGGEDSQRVLRAPIDGLFRADKAIGDKVIVGDVIGRVGSQSIPTAIAGVVRGVLYDGLSINAGVKVADIDPRGEVSYCFSVSDKAWSIGGGVLEAVMCLSRMLPSGL
jgi:xanthine dehydrogenase accessory factor